MCPSLNSIYMKVYLQELSEESKHLHYDERDAWVVEAFRDAQESDAVNNHAYAVNLDVRKSHGVVFMKGKLAVDLGLLCSRCANAFKQNVKASFQCLFTREKDLARAENSSGGVAYSEPTGETGEDIDIEFLDKDYIELADVLKEQIYLKVPIQPLCDESCKGICAVCGQDQNTQPCQCHRIKNTSLANALKNFRIS